MLGRGEGLLAAEPPVDDQAIENLKFSAVIPRDAARDTVSRRLADRESVRETLGAPLKAGNTNEQASRHTPSSRSSVLLMRTFSWTDRLRKCRAAGFGYRSWMVEPLDPNAVLLRRAIGSPELC